MKKSIYIALMDKTDTLRKISRNMREHSISYYALERYAGVPRSTIMRAVTQRHETRDKTALELWTALVKLADDKGLELV